MLREILRGITALSLVILLAGCGEGWLTGEGLDTDPNRATAVPTDNLYVAVQVDMFGTLTGPLSHVAVMFLQQMSGVAQHWSGYELYEMTPSEFGGMWVDVYGGGGLFDIKALKAAATEKEKYTLLGIAEVWEALLISTTSDLWGDVPYSEAADPENFPTPKYDKQSAAHDAMLKLIDQAITDLEKGKSRVDAKTEFFDGSFDFTFEGDHDNWIAAAHTIKARMLLNWAEVREENYAKALSEAQMGIASYEDNLRASHSSTDGEQSMWWQFETRRFGYVKGSSHLVNLLKDQNDPRLEVYFGLDAEDKYSGSDPGENNDNASFLNPETFGGADWDTEIVIWSENQFIIAESQYAAGKEADALATLDATQAGLETKWGLDANSLPRHADSTGVGLLEAIMMEKYKALFLNVQIWSDWKRTAFPILPSTPKDRQIPRRYLYSDDEINTNPNVTFLDFDVRTENDPGNPTYPGRTVNP